MRVDVCHHWQFFPILDQFEHYSIKSQFIRIVNHSYQKIAVPTIVSPLHDKLGRVVLKSFYNGVSGGNHSNFDQCKRPRQTTFLIKVLYDLDFPTAAGSSSQVRDQIIKILEIVNIR